MPIPFKLTKLGTLRLEAPVIGWYVDGEGALCPQCATPEEKSRDAQTETWSEHDRRSVLESLTPEPISTCSICHGPWDQEHRRGHCPDTPIRFF